MISAYPYRGLQGPALSDSCVLCQPHFGKEEEEGGKKGEVRTEVYELNKDLLSPAPPHTFFFFFFFWMTVPGFVVSWAGTRRTAILHSSSVTQLPKAGPGTRLPFHRTIKYSGSGTDKAGLFAFDNDHTWGRYGTCPCAQGFQCLPRDRRGPEPSRTGREKS